MKDKNDTNLTEAFNSALSGVFRNGMPIQPDTQREPVCHFREALMDEILAERPGLRRAKLSKQMAEMGF